MKKVYVSPSILNCNFAALGDECKSLAECGADWIHCDVMDGQFVPNISFGASVVKSIHERVDIPLDVHLMIDEPIRFVKDFVEAGADIVTFHVEATDKIEETVREIRRCGAKVGLSVKPNTPVEVLTPYKDEIDLVLIMSVEPGFGGQKFMPSAIEKVRQASKLCPNAVIEVDGGINESNVSDLLKAGANAIVAGSSVIKATDRKSVIENLRKM